MPCRIAEACPERPPPFTVQNTSKGLLGLMISKGCCKQTCEEKRKKYSVLFFPLTVMVPLPCLIQTRAMDSFLFPVA